VAAERPGPSGLKKRSRSRRGLVSDEEEFEPKKDEILADTHDPRA